MGKILQLLQETGNFIHRINETLYFYININPKVPWLVIILMAGLFVMVTKFLKDNKLTSFELVILLGVYLSILGAVTTSYMDLEVIRSREHSEYTFFMVVIGALSIVVLISILGVVEKTEIRKASIIGALYFPIILLVLTNGEILEKRLDSLKALMPRSNSSIIGLLGEIDHVYVGGTMPKARRAQVEQMIMKRPHVKDCAIVCRKDNSTENGDGDGYVKPYALVVTFSNEFKRGRDKREIFEYLQYNVKKGKLSPYDVPRWIEFVKEIPRNSKKQVKYVKLQKKIQNWSDLFAGHPNQE